VVRPADAGRIDGRPGRYVLAQVVGAQDGGVPGQVVEVVHNDGHEQIEHEESGEEDEANEVAVGEVHAALLVAG